MNTREGDTQRPPFAVVFFAESRTRRVPVRRLAKALRRSGFRRMAVRSALIRVCSRSVVCHTAIGVGPLVLEPRPSGCVLCPIEHYAIECPGLVRMVNVPLLATPCITAWDGRPLGSTARALARWATRGRVRGNDCVSTVCAVLRCGGVFPPRRIVTPDALMRWLQANGMEHVNTVRAGD